MKSTINFLLLGFALFFLACEKEEKITYTPPTATTTDATDITTTDAKIGMGVTAIGTGIISEYGIVYGTTDKPTILTGTKMSLGTTLSAATSSSVTLTNLTPGTMYYARSFVKNDKDTYYGNAISFSTGALKPGVVTLAAATSVANATFTIPGSVTDIGTGGVTNYGHCVSETNQTPTITDTKTELGALTAAPKSFVSTFSSLKEGTTYYVRAYITNNSGTAYSDVTQVKTSNLIAPTGVSTGSANNILSTSAKISGTITAPGSNSIKAYGHVWSDTKNLPTIDDSKTTLTAAGTFPLNYNSDLGSLKTNTTYYARAYASSDAGTTYSTATSFKTSNTADELTIIKDVSLTMVRGSAYSADAQPAFVELTTGKVFTVGEGPANAAKIDLIVWLAANSENAGQANYDEVQFVTPSKALNYDKFWGDFPTKLGTQNWSTYKGTKLSNFSSTTYPVAATWDKVNTSTDLTSLITASYVGLGAAQLDVLRADGTLLDNVVYVFQTKEGKYGIIKITDGQKKANSYSIKFDIKVQK